MAVGRSSERTARGGWTLAVEGPSGAGKTTTSRALARALSAEWIPEAFERLRPRPDLRFSSAGSLARLEARLLGEERRRFAEAGRLRARGGRVVLDTGFLGPVTYAAGLARIDPALRPALRSIVRRAAGWAEAGRLGLPDETVYLLAGREAIARRLARDPVGHPPQLGERHARVARWERRLWLGRFRRLYPERIIALRSDRATSSIVDRTAKRLSARLVRPPPTSAAALRVLRAFGR